MRVLERQNVHSWTNVASTRVQTGTHQSPIAKIQKILTNISSIQNLGAREPYMSIFSLVQNELISVPAADPVRWQVAM